MKVYLLNESDIERLRTMIDRDPQHGSNGGSSNATVNDGHNRMVYDEAHRFYNYQICKWIDEVRKAQ